eukprot:TRINITY_DN14230_c0_g1_i1.p1 TRINITY_DN14230_c0_g1~~TRINITY_DN14230_c0_g1_i1.p1  ORF type:complete len:270 (+),score=33.93 TRINITY_DN14230_c0_g1_i1:263-1072(+)
MGQQWLMIWCIFFTLLKKMHSYEWTQLSDANNEFGLMLHGEICGSQNCVFSPFSISTACAMLLAGAAGETSKQMKYVMNYDSFYDDDIRKGFKFILSMINGKQAGYISHSRQFELLTANRILTQYNYKLHQNFSDIMSEYFEASTENVNFEGDAEGVRKNVNSWVSAVTQEMIKEFLPAGSVNPLTRAMILNAVYFKGLWEIPFEQYSTKQEEFFVGQGYSKLVDTMNVISEFRTREAEWLKSSIVELPYQGFDLCMTIILPNEGHRKD